MVTIGIDIDDTLVKTNEKALEIIEREGYESVDYYENIFDLSGFISKHFLEIVESANLFEGSKTVIKELRNKGYKIILISARAFQSGADTESDTICYLKKHGIEYDSILLRKPNKVEACLQESVDYFIDDKEKPLDALTAVGVKCIKMQSVDKRPTKYFAVNNWYEILNYFNNI